MNELIWLYNRMISHQPAAYHMSFLHGGQIETEESREGYFQYLVDYEVYLMVRRLYMKKLKSAKYSIRYSIVFAQSIKNNKNIPKELNNILLRIYYENWR